MSTATISEQVQVCGIWVDLEAECDLKYHDDSFSHEFGTERCGHWEIEEIYGMWWEDARQCVIDQIADPKRNRRFKKRVRQWVRKIEQAILAMDPEDAFSKRAKDSVIENRPEPKEPDYRDME